MAIATVCPAFSCPTTTHSMPETATRERHPRHGRSTARGHVIAHEHAANDLDIELIVLHDEHLACGLTCRVRRGRELDVGALLGVCMLELLDLAHARAADEYREEEFGACNRSAPSRMAIRAVPRSP